MLLKFQDKVGFALGCAITCSLLPTGHGTNAANSAFHLTTSNIQDAIRLWQENRTLAQELYGGPMEEWDTSQVTSLSFAFHKSQNFYADLSKWNTSALTYMGGTFAYAKNFTANISTWDTSRVENMDYAFRYTDNFAADVSKWNLDSVSSLNGAFQGSKNLQADVSAWDTSKVHDFTRAFYKASWFDKALCWDLSSADPPTLTQFSCHTKGGLDCSCPSLEGSQSTVNLCSIINSGCNHYQPPCIVTNPKAPNFCTGQGSMGMGMGMGMAEEGNLDPSGDPSFGGVLAKAFLYLGLPIIAVVLVFRVKRRSPLLLAPPEGSPPPNTKSKELELVRALV